MLAHKMVYWKVQSYITEPMFHLAFTTAGWMVSFSTSGSLKNWFCLCLQNQWQLWIMYSIRPSKLKKWQQNTQSWNWWQNNCQKILSNLTIKWENTNGSVSLSRINQKEKICDINWLEAKAIKSFAFLILK